MKVKAGMYFSVPYADANCRYRIVRHIGGGVWECVDDDDYNGVVRHVSEGLIIAIIEAGKHAAESSEEWFDSLPTGTVVHLCNGFHQFVRCEVVQAGYKDIGERPAHWWRGEKCVRPTDLVGDWHSADLPSRKPNGEIHYSYYPHKIMEEICFRPNPSNFYENPNDYWKIHEIVPTSLEPLSLEVLPPTEEELEQIERQKVADEVTDLLAEEVTLEVLRRASNLLKDFLKDR